jgi:hypothetical protein
MKDMIGFKVKVEVDLVVLFSKITIKEAKEYLRYLVEEKNIYAELSDDDMGFVREEKKILDIKLLDTKPIDDAFIDIIESIKQ